MRDVRRALAADGAFDLLVLASGLLAVVDPRQRDPFAQEEAGELSRDELLASFLEVDRRETSALLTVMAAMIGDELTARRIERELDRRGGRLPDAVSGLEPVEVGAPVRTSHVLPDGDNYLFPVRTAAGERFTALVYVDHNMGMVVKDAFVIPASLDLVRDRLDEASGGDPDTTVVGVDPADARVIVTEAIECGARTCPPFETETWPACRPLVEWLLRELPAGGRGYEHPEWSPEEREALADGFLASPYGAAHGSEPARDQLDWLLWFACDYGPGDPLRWSPVRVELALVDFVPRKIVAPVEDLRGLPGVLRDLVRFGHGETGIRSSLTEETVAAVDRWEPEYQRLIASPRPQGVDALFAAMGLRSAGGEDGPWQLDPLARLAEQVGGPDELEALDDAPLPDEPFDGSVLPDDDEVARGILEIGELLDGACDRFFDVEPRTACRRLLADVARADPGVLVRGKAGAAAAALAWLIARANDSFGSYSGGLTVGELNGWFGVYGSASQRAGTFLKVLGLDVPYRSASWTPLGSVRYLTSAERRRLADQRDRLRDQTG